MLQIYSICVGWPIFYQFFLEINKKVGQELIPAQLNYQLSIINYTLKMDY